MMIKDWSTQSLVSNRSLDGKRREALNEILDIKGSIRVICRVWSRPPPSTDRRNVQSSILAGAEKIIVKSARGAKKSSSPIECSLREKHKRMYFKKPSRYLDSCSTNTMSASLLMARLEPEGRNDQPGIAPRSIKELFHRADQDRSASFTFSMSMLENYLRSIRDLFTVKHSSCSRAYQSTCKGGQWAQYALWQ